MMDKRIEFILGYLEDNPEKEITLTTASKMVNLSYNYLSELFKKEVGTSFSLYLKNKRIKRAKKLLKESFLSIKEISFETGSRHVSSFCKEFKNILGISPSAYRNKIKINDDFDK